jgi:hypothetical protein
MTTIRDVQLWKDQATEPVGLVLEALNPVEVKWNRELARIKELNDELGLYDITDQPYGFGAVLPQPDRLDHIRKLLDFLAAALERKDRMRARHYAHAVLEILNKPPNGPVGVH